MLQRVKVNGSRLMAWAITRIMLHRLSPIPQRSVDEVNSPRFLFIFYQTIEQSVKQTVNN